MNRLPNLSACLLSLSLSFAPVALTAGPLKAGAAISDITPREYPLAMRGSFTPQLTSSAHDPLQVRALVLSDDQTTVAIAIVDSCMVARSELDLAKEAVAKATGIPANRQLIASTHTHSAPFSNASNGTPQEIAYQKQLIEGIAESIIKAHANLRPASVGWGGHDVPDEVFNRRWFLKPGTMPANPFGETTDLAKMNPGALSKDLIFPAGPIDPEVSILSVRDAKSGQPLSLLANYSLHYVGSIPGSQLSADYFGEFGRLLPNRLYGSREPGEFVGMLSNGTSGDINNTSFSAARPPREPFEQIRLVAAKVADASWHADKAIANFQTDLPLAMVEREVTLKLRVPTPEQIERSKAILAIAGDDEKKLPKLAKNYAERILALVEQGETDAIKLQAIRIGDLVIGSIPFETFAEIGLDLKQRSPFGDTFTIELANGAGGYLPTPRQHEFGGYETWLSTNKVQKDASVIITDQLLEMFAELKAKKP